MLAADYGATVADYRVVVSHANKFQKEVKMTILRDRLLKYGFHIFGSLFFGKRLKGNTYGLSCFMTYDMM